MLSLVLSSTGFHLPLVQQRQQQQLAVNMVATVQPLPPVGFVWADDEVTTISADAVKEAVGVVTPTKSASVPKYTDTTIELTPEQVVAFGGPATRPFNDRDAAAPTTGTDSVPKYTDTTIELTPEQVVAFGGPATRPFNDR